MENNNNKKQKRRNIAMAKINKTENDAVLPQYALDSYRTDPHDYIIINALQSHYTIE